MEELERVYLPFVVRELKKYKETIQSLRETERATLDRLSLRKGEFEERKGAFKREIALLREAEKTLRSETERKILVENLKLEKLQSEYRDLEGKNRELSALSSTLSKVEQEAEMLEQRSKAVKVFCNEVISKSEDLQDLIDMLSSSRYPGDDL